MSRHKAQCSNIDGRQNYAIHIRYLMQSGTTIAIYHQANLGLKTD